MFNRQKCFWKYRKKYLKSNVKIFKKYYEFRCRLLNRKSNSGIPLNNNINEFVAPHGLSGIYISKNSKIGKNCTIFHQVTIGLNDIKDSVKYGSPIIGANCYIGAGAKIIGNVKIGNNCRIGANCVVTEDIEDNCTVVMQKPRIIKR